MHKVQKLNATAYCTSIPEYLSYFKRLYLTKYLSKMAPTRVIRKLIKIPFM